MTERSRRADLVVPPTADDVELADRLARDLDATFESLVLAHQDRLFTIAFRTGGDRHDAEELVQDCFVRAYRALATYAPPRIRELRLRGWLTTILLNAGRNRARVRRVPAWSPGPPTCTGCRFLRSSRCPIAVTTETSTSRR